MGCGPSCHKQDSQVPHHHGCGSRLCVCPARHGSLCRQHPGRNRDPGHECLEQTLVGDGVEVPA